MLEMLDWVDRFNKRRLLEPIGDIPPAEYGELYFQQQKESARVEVLTYKVYDKPGAVHFRGENGTAAYANILLKQGIYQLIRLID